MAYTTLAQGSSVTLTLNDQFDGLEVINRSQDLATVALTSGAWGYGATPQQHSGRRVYQLSSAGSITLTASSGALQYELTDASDNRVAQSFSVAETSSIRALLSRAGKTGAASRPNYCSIGNSISAQAGPGYGLAYTTEYYSDIQHALAFAGHTLQPVRIGGSAAMTTLSGGGNYSDGTYGWSGATSVQIAADLPQFFALITSNIDVFFVNTMENDAPSANTAAATTAAYDSIIAQMLAKGAALIYWKMCLPNTGTNTAPKLAMFWTLLRYIENKAATTSQLRIVPTYDLWTDSSNAYPVPLNAGLFANYTDGAVHPRKGSLWLGQRLADAMALDGLTYERRVQAPAVGNAGFIGGSANMVGTGGTFSGGYSGTPATPPTGLTVSTSMATITTATCNAAVYKGRPCLEFTAVSSGAQGSAQNALAVFMGLQTTGWSVGDTVQLLVEFVLDSTVPITGIRGIYGQILLAGSSGSANVNRHASADAFNEDFVYDRPIMIATPLLIVPAATTSLRPFFYAITDTAAAVSIKGKVLSFRLVNWTTAS